MHRLGRVKAAAYSRSVRSPSEVSTPGGSYPRRLPDSANDALASAADGGERLLSALLAHALLDAAEAQGADRSSVLAAAECPLGERSGIGDWISWSNFSRLISAACEQTRDSAFGVHWAEHTP